MRSRAYFRLIGCCRVEAARLRLGRAEDPRERERRFSTSAMSNASINTRRVQRPALPKNDSAKPRAPLCVLTIAGSDSGGGAGIQADLRTIHALGAFAATAISAVTAQNTLGVSAWRAMQPKLLAQQIAAVCEDLPVAVIKTGLLPGPAAVRAVADALKAYARIPLVVDPVIGSTSGTRFLSATGLRALQEELLPRATLVTPNWLEAAALSGLPVTTMAQVEAAGRAILKLTGCRAVLVKGGHAPGSTCEDWLFLANGRTFSYAHSRIETINTHGTGCVLSAAIATRLALGDELPEAVRAATDFLQTALRKGRSRSWGRGRGPAFAG